MCIRDSFSRAVREETAASRFKLKADGDGGGGEGGGGEPEGAGSRPTPLVALRLLREIQEQRSLAVKVGVVQGDFEVCVPYLCNFCLTIGWTWRCWDFISGMFVFFISAYFFSTLL